MYRIHRNLRRAGIDSKILCEQNFSGSRDVLTLPRPPKIEAVLERVAWQFGLVDIHRFSSFKIAGHVAFREADIVHFHGLHGGFLNYLALPRLTKDKPGVFNLSDFWPMTGHCAVSYDCQRWKTGCGRCPYLSAPPAIKRDSTALQWKLKNWAYHRSNLTFVSLCTQYAERAKESMIGDMPVYLIPYGVDTDIYRPMDPQSCRRLLGLDPQRKVLMFAALGLNQHNKGGDLLLKALRSLPERLKRVTVLLLLGNGGQRIAEAVGMEAVNLGFVASSRLQRIAYSAADVFVSPTRGEAFGQVIIESMACGTPVVAFGVGGVLDTVRPGITGYRAEPEDAEDLAAGILELLEDEPRRVAMGRRCRQVVEEEYSAQLETRRYIDIYRRILGLAGEGAQSGGSSAGTEKVQETQQETPTIPVSGRRVLP